MGLGKIPGTVFHGAGKGPFLAGSKLKLPMGIGRLSEISYWNVPAIARGPKGD